MCVYRRKALNSETTAAGDTTYVLFFIFVLKYRSIKYTRIPMYRRNNAIGGDCNP